jgi:polysaccharide export outer membrane protein
MIHRVHKVLLQLYGLLGSALLLAFVPGLASAGEQTAPPSNPPAAATPSPGQPATVLPSSGEPPASIVNDAQYVIGPGDVIQIFVWRSPELSVTVPVRPDGKISSPLVEDMVAVGKTPSQLARDMEIRLAEYVRSPQVNVIVTAPANAFNQVKVIGQVHAPRSLAYRAGMTALDAVLETGGLTEFAAGNRAVLVRKDANGKETRVKLRLNDLVKKGKISSNVELKPGDVLIVPESMF